MDRSTARSIIYNFLSLCYTYPDEEVCPWIAQGEWIKSLRESLSLLTEEDFERYLRTFEGLISDQKEEMLSLEMGREYTRLFINAFPHVVAPPYGSIYLEKGGLVFGETTSEVLRFYHEAGFTLKEELRDLPDHIAQEFEFMGILADQESQTTGSEKIKLEEKQMEFFSHFILPWVPDFCEKIETQSLFPFYRCLGMLTREFVDLERNYLGIPEELNSRKEIAAGKKEVQNG